MALDLEMNQPSGSIIQIGAVVGNIRTRKILQKECVFVSQEEVVSEYITGLTGITQEQMQSGLTLINAYSQLNQLMKVHKCFMNPITWGGNDVDVLKKQLYAWCIKNNVTQPESWCFGRRWIDAKTVFVSYCAANSKSAQGSLAKSMTKLGLSFKGKKHNAADDAENTFYIYCSLLDVLKNKNKV